MLEFIQAVLTIITKVVPDVLKRRKETYFNKIGVELFLFYMQANEALVCAQGIIDYLESYVSNVERFGKRDRSPSLHGLIAHRIEQQIINLVKISETLHRCEFYLYTISGDSVSRLAPLLSYKASVLNALLTTMRQSYLPLSVRLENLEEDQDSDGDLDYYSIRADLYERIVVNSISLQSPWGSDVYQAVKAYLEQTNPRLRIDQIRSALTELGSGLANTFTVKDIILEAGDIRFGERDSLHLHHTDYEIRKRNRRA